MLSRSARAPLLFALRRRMLELHTIVLFGLLVRRLGAVFEILPHTVKTLRKFLAGLASGLPSSAGSSAFSWT